MADSVCQPGVHAENLRGEGGNSGIVCWPCAPCRLQENIRANLCKLLDAHPSVVNIKVGRGILL